MQQDYNWDAAVGKERFLLCPSIGGIDSHVVLHLGCVAACSDDYRGVDVADFVRHQRRRRCQTADHDNRDSSAYRR